MITNWKVFNFKSIREETELDFGPLTIFAGANSSGKSTIIQSILLVAQTLAHKVSSRSVVLNGALISLGQFDDLKSNGGTSDQITISWACRPVRDNVQSQVRRSLFGLPPGFAFYSPRSSQLQEIACEISFDADVSGSERDLFQIQPRLFATHLSCTFRDEDNVDQVADVSVHHSNKAVSEIEGNDSANDLDDKLRASLAYAVALDDVSFVEVTDDYRTAKPIGCVLRHFLPARIVYAVDTLEEQASTFTKALQSDVLRRRTKMRETFLPEEVIAVLRDVLVDIVDFDKAFMKLKRIDDVFVPDSNTLTIESWYERLRSLPSDKQSSIQQVLRDRDDLFDRICESMRGTTTDKHVTIDYLPMRPPRWISEASQYLETSFASSLQYLGPLRDAPKPLYPLAPAADPYDVGTRGEHTASILDLHKNRMIQFIPSSNFSGPIVDRKTVTRTLEGAVIDWLQYLGVADSVKSRDQGKLGHELKVGLAGSDSSHDLTHVGVGVSQVLPILVMCLLADTDSTLVFEQPELHLHPKVQTLLGDFFLSMALCNKQCIVETHSEYFIDRLRYRIAAATTEKALTDVTKIYFVEKPAQGSVFRQVTINEYGAISDWPAGFFDQSQQQAEDILIAAAQKRRLRRTNADV